MAMACKGASAPVARPARPLAAIIADSNRREAASTVTRAELPAWVQQMAPPELRPAHAEESFAAGATMNRPPLDGDWELLADAESAIAYPEAEPALAGMSDELIAFLSQAMDSDFEVEITPEIMTDLNITGTTDRLAPEILEALDLFETSINQEASAGQGQPGQEVRSPASQLDDALSPLEIYLTWAEQGIDQDAAWDEPSNSTISAAEIASAMENTGPPASPSAAVQTSAQSGAPVDTSRRGSTRKAKTDLVIPWFLALLVIVVVMILVAVIIYMILFPESHFLLS